MILISIEIQQCENNVHNIFAINVHDIGVCSKIPFSQWNTVRIGSVGSVLTHPIFGIAQNYK